MPRDLPGTLLLDPQVIDDPYPFYRELQMHAPVWQVPGTEVFIVSSFAMVAEAVARVEDFSSNIHCLLYCDDAGLPSRLTFGGAARPTEIPQNTNTPTRWLSIGACRAITSHSAVASTIVSARPLPASRRGSCSPHFSNRPAASRSIPNNHRGGSTAFWCDATSNSRCNSLPAESRRLRTCHLRNRRRAFAHDDRDRVVVGHVRYRRGDDRPAVGNSPVSKCGWRDEPTARARRASLPARRNHSPSFAFRHRGKGTKAKRRAPPAVCSSGRPRDIHHCVDLRPRLVDLARWVY